MFERLAGKVLSTLLSKYFTEESLAKNKVATSAQMGVWSGYISLENLELKKDVINDILRRRGQPFEIIHSSFRRVEITVPWSKLSPSSRAASTDDSKEDAVVVVVIDGVHILARSSFVFDDVALRKHKIDERRKALEDAASFGRPVETDDSAGLTYTEMIKKRITDSLLHEMVDKLQIHLRDFHIRLEDVESDPDNPFAIGVTMESMHVQHDQGTEEGVVQKVAQLNHFAIYWNALEYGKNVPAEHSVMQKSFQDSPERLSRALDLSITRRASPIASPSRNPYIPTNTYLLLPVDGILKGSLSSDPNDLTRRPALSMDIDIDAFSLQIRDFQCMQILGFVNSFKNHSFTKKYRTLRPLVSVKENPRLWWRYASRVILYQLKENSLRWSWGRFQKRYQSRGRYMELYGRHLKFPSADQIELVAGNDVNGTENNALVSNGHGNWTDEDETPDFAAGPSVRQLQIQTETSLSESELQELKNLEDGIQGDLSISDIILFRAVVSMRLGRPSNSNGHAAPPRTSWWRRTVANVATDDFDATEEFERLLAYVDEASTGVKGVDSLNKRSQTAISIVCCLGQGCVAFYAPLNSTIDQTQRRRLHERFFEVVITDLRIGLSLMGDYESSTFHVTLVDIMGKEIRADSTTVVMRKASRVSAEQNPFIVFSMINNAPKSQACDIELVAFVDKLDFLFVPDCQWILGIKQLLQNVSSLPKIADFWSSMALAYFNSIASGRLKMKAHAAGLKHKNMDLDVTVQCPIVRIGDGVGRFLVIDLGIAHLKTEKLAGIAQTKLSGQSQVQYPEPTAHDSIDDMSESSRSMLRKIVVKKNYYRSSAMSVDSRAFSGGPTTRSLGGSMYFDDHMTFNRTDPVTGPGGSEGIQSFFYDAYQLCLLTGKVTMEGSRESMTKDITTGVEIRTTIEKSVIPADHTLCRLKAHCVVGNFSLVLSESLILSLANLVEKWRTAIAGYTSPQPFTPKEELFSISAGIIPGLVHAHSTASLESEDIEEEKDEEVSQVDEQEFFDANDGYDSFSAGHSGVWFDDNWISDAASFIDTDSRSHTRSRRGRRRQPSVVSDMSSVSDQSTKGRRGHGNAYLNAENLARLEEGAGEDESLAESGGDIDNDSFHSAFSIGGRVGLALELEQDIEKVQEKIERLKGRLGDLSRPASSWTPLKFKEMRERRTTRKHTKLELDRAVAELSALKALHCDLQSQPHELEQEDIERTLHDSSTRHSVTVDGNQPARRARAVLNAKKKQDLNDTTDLHKMTRDLNPKLFEGSLLFTNLKIRAQLEESSSSEPSSHRTSQHLELCMSQTGLALFHCNNDTKVYFGIEHVTAGLTSNERTGPSRRLLFLGGTIDSLADNQLPVHFPQYIARSMEEKLVRGALYHRRRLTDEFNSPSETLKLRLVLGDMEFTPRGQYVKAIVGALSRLQSGLRGCTLERSRVDNSTISQDDANQEILGSPELIDQPIVDATVPSDATNRTKYYDFAVRCTSLRVAMCHSNQVVGACTIAETNIRCVHVSSNVVLKSRSQVDLRCSNFQVLHITSLEEGKGSEIMGRSDPYTHLINLRLRRQLVPAYETGGWVVGFDKAPTKADGPSAKTVWNLHVGLKVSPILVVAAPVALEGIAFSVREFRSSFSDHYRTMNQQAQMMTMHMGRKHTPSKSLVPSRWRVDVSFRRALLSFPNQGSNDATGFDAFSNSLSLSLSTLVSLERASLSSEALCFRVALVEVSLVKSPDDWPILDPFTVISEAFMLSQVADDISNDEPKPTLMFPIDSPWNEIFALMDRHSWAEMPRRPSEALQKSLAIKVSPIKANLSAPICGLLVKHSQKFQSLFSKKNMAEGSDKESSSIMTSPCSKWWCHVSLTEVEASLLRESGSKPISFAEQLVALHFSDVQITYENGEGVMLSVLIGDSSLYDLSSFPGVRVLGKDPMDDEIDVTIASPSFVRLLYKFDQRKNKPKTLRLDINWGRIQCLVLPSFLRSVFGFLDTMKSLLGSKSGPDRAIKSRKSALRQFLKMPDDFNFVLSADADSFECILSSKDIGTYVREKSSEPIGVVAFRWKAKLQVSLALDGLHESSSPWKTLNPSENFTDPSDVDLFRDFCNRYLDQSSGFLAGSDEVGHKLINAFTAKVDLKVDDFEALRTNISSPHLLSSAIVSSSYKSEPRVYFKVNAPIAGERRITNSMNFGINYRLAGAAMSNINDGTFSDPQVEISQLFQLEAKFVDILLYISQTTGGATEAFRVTVKPILDMIKRKDDREPPKPKRYLGDQDEHAGLLDMVSRASTMCSIKAEGFQATCVPGGATQLTESPIIKFELSNVCIGLALVPVAKDVKLMTESAVDSTGASNPLISGIDLMHLNAAGWMNCELSAEYHNRRLVAWEPFIEPWMVDVRVGADLVEVFDLQPILKSRLSQWQPPADPMRSEFGVLNAASINERAGERLRDIGRLFRSPFRSSSSAKPSQSGAMSNEFLSHHDFCYLMLASSARMTITTVLYPSVVPRPDNLAPIFSSFPSHRPMDWLGAFGFPQTAAQEGPSPSSQYSFACLVSDVRPLNINLTGALIENVLGYLDNAKRDAYRTVAPHWIRNDSGMTIRFQEVLDADRIRRGDKAGKVTISNGSEVPLTLKRSLSQSCDPHKAYIMLELGSFEDAVGRVSQDDLVIPKGSRSSTFVYKAVAKIPVDTVGVHRYPLDRNIEKRSDLQPLGTDSRAVGWIIVRVALKGGIKMVSVESPFVLKSNADADLLCEIRDHNGLSLLWRCLIPKPTGEGGLSSAQSMVSVPADIVPFIHDGSYVFSAMALHRNSCVTHETELLAVNRDGAMEVSTPPPFSPESFNRGLVDENEISLTTLAPKGLSGQDDDANAKKVHLSVCSLRIGSYLKPTVDIPEQRMVFFRSPLVIRNYLALPIAVQARVKSGLRSGKRFDSSASASSRNAKDGTLLRQPTNMMEWEDLGTLDCGHFVNWTGALSTDKVEIRVKFSGIDSENSRTFPSWSTALTIPAREKRMGARSISSDDTSFYQMRVFDASNIPLRLSVAIGVGGGDSDPSSYDNIKLFSQDFSPASRVISIYVPYWIVDGTGQDLEFSTGGAVAGQVSRRVPTENKDYQHQKNGLTMGLAELLEDDRLMHLPSRSPFEVIMIGDDRASRLTVRRRARQRGSMMLRESVSPWSDPIPLQTDRSYQHDVTVLVPDESSTPADLVDFIDASHSYQYALRSSIVFAPEQFGGKLGTQLVHIVNRYMIVNETGRDIEIAAEYGNVVPVLLRSGCNPQPFHFDDSSQIRFRFKEFGWTWSGNFYVRSNRREVTLRLRHKMKGHVVVATVESHSRKKSATILIVFRLATHPPFRLENHTMYPLHFGQSTGLMGAEDSAMDSMLLPYQSADFAWDEPDLRRRALVVKAANSTDIPNQVDTILGRFYLDRIAPGTAVCLESDMFKGEVVADGPTRVFRVSDASMPRLPSFRQDEQNEFHQKPQMSSVLSVSLIIKLSHGFGVSVVDWSPQELIYARFDGIQLERKIDMNKDAVSLAIGNIVVNNQMWVTPYPVLFKMGRRPDSHTARRRHRRHNAVLLSWRRAVNTHGGYGNSTLLESVELSSGPLFINADGNLANLLIRMAQQISETRAKDMRSAKPSSRDLELKKILDISGEVAPDDSSSPRKKIISSYDWGPNGDFCLTSAIAAKLKSSQPSKSSANFLFTRNSSSLLRGRNKAVSLSKPRHKYYLEKLRISGAIAELSWSGPLPRAFSSLLLKALTFEGLPVRLSPFSSSHAYGTAEDHLQSLKSHYVSFWRVFDLLMGLAFNPTFLLRAVLYTGRESVASILDSWAQRFKIAADNAQNWVITDDKMQPTYDDGLPVQSSLPPYQVVQRAIVKPFISPSVFILRVGAGLNAWGSSQLRYGPQKDSGAQRSTSGLVRSRTPRLFANVDGKDLLVEYVEGQNAGKAILSRVRSGSHLGEGYIVHTEGTRQRSRKDISSERIDSSPLIFMMTSERVLLLNGKLDINFCSVVWEATFENIVHVEVTVDAVPSTKQSVDLLEIWYLASPGLVNRSLEDMRARYTKGASGFYSGINVLHNKSMFVPCDTAKHLLAKMGGIDKSLVENIHE